MPVIVTLAALGALAACAVGWTFFAIRGVRRALDGTARGPAPTALAEISVLAGLVLLIRGDPVLAFLALGFPPIALLAIPNPADHAVLLGQAVVFAVPVALIVFLACVLGFPKALFAVILPSMLGGATLIAVADRFAGQAVCETAQVRGLSDIRRHSLFWSLANTPREFQFDLHGLARQGDRHFGWSYSEMDWYVLPDTFGVDTRAGRPVCTER
ncbi:hypothetical protein KUH32_10730 [Thalassococcus sp. CAU 1522]|uniref:Uncharacterized protein n=1 Tax=Thalassococcus arenae TaxID=2851652 RepID=A0ABS6N8B8_9RHOB|nr:hypothetical protein [Thalassococcus arenae]MBV2360251.1 hypothetical protein [Thalassococcus arenae]